MPDIWFPHLGIEIEKLSRVAFSVLGKDVYWYGVLIGLGVILGLVFAMMEAKRTKQNPDLYVDFLIYALIFAIIGARLYYVIFSWEYYAANPMKIFALREGGLAIYGGIIGAVLTAIVYCKKKNVDFWLLADTACPSIAFGQMMGRWGNFFNREAFGGFTDGIFAMRLRLDQVRPGDISQQVMERVMNFGGVDYIQVHPTFLYESVWNLCLFLLLVLYRPKKKFAGQIMGLYFLGYALGRVWIEGLRTDQLLIGGFAVSQLLSAGLIVASVLFLIWKGRKEKAAE
ncbi:MAG: prolipoprotein diacylglyceryl transferase [Bacillota bacterium]|nr:prolipoprotein diacylglyceryl transferase [Bacillota bacterium]